MVLLNQKELGDISLLLGVTRRFGVGDRSNVGKSPRGPFHASLLVRGGVISLESDVCREASQMESWGLGMMLSEESTLG